MTDKELIDKLDRYRRGAAGCIMTDEEWSEFVRLAMLGLEAESAPVVGYERKWHADGEKPFKEKNKNGRLAWALRFKFVPYSKVKCLPDDLALIHKPEVKG